MLQCHAHAHYYVRAKGGEEKRSFPQLLTTTHTDYTCSHQLNFAFSLLQSAFFATNFSLKKRDPNLELF